MPTIEGTPKRKLSDKSRSILRNASKGLEPLWLGPMSDDHASGEESLSRCREQVPLLSRAVLHLDGGGTEAVASRDGTTSWDSEICGMSARRLWRRLQHRPKHQSTGLGKKDGDSISSRRRGKSIWPGTVSGAIELTRCSSPRSCTGNGSASSSSPVYIDYWAEHPDMLSRVPVFAEKVFHVAYRLPSGRTVYLKGKWDSVDCVASGDAESGIQRALWIMENKTKSNPDEEIIERQLSFDLQTGIYATALDAFCKQATG